MRICGGINGLMRLMRVSSSAESGEEALLWKRDMSCVNRKGKKEDRKKWMWWVR